MPLTNSTKTTILMAIVGENNAFSASAYLALSSTEPFASGTTGTNITEPNTGGYGRVLLGRAGGEPNIFQHYVGAMAVANSKEIYFPESTGSWGAPLTYFAIVKSDTGSLTESDVIAYGTLNSPVTVDKGNVVVMFRTYQLRVSLE
jgi:hypothetical protein